MWGTDRTWKRPRSSLLLGKGLTTERGGQGVVVTVLQQERKQAKSTLVHRPLVTLKAPGWSGTTPDGPAPSEVRTSRAPPWEKEGRLLGPPSDLPFAHSDPLFTLHRAVRCRESPGQAA